MSPPRITPLRIPLPRKRVLLGIEVCRDADGRLLLARVLWLRDDGLGSWYRPKDVIYRKPRDPTR